jgi:tRNA acetyltransferase TAN1
LCRRTVAAYCTRENGGDGGGRKVCPSPSLHTDRKVKLTNHDLIGQYKIELRIRNHNTLTRMEIIQEVARCMPEGYTVDLDDPEVFVLVEVFKVRAASVVFFCFRCSFDLGILVAEHVWSEHR